MPEQLSHAEVLGAYCGTFVDELVAAGVKNVCLCPGSRSTPLALTFARHPGVKLWVHLDERSCAYFALGMASGTPRRTPVAILCSSGTAAVNFAPAVIEAFHSHVPLIVLTADRPPELQGLGANQTIDQYNLYGSAVKWFVNLPLPEATEQMLRYLRMVADRTIARARSGGPVHLNFQFREPLVPAAYEFSTGLGRREKLTSAASNSSLSSGWFSDMLSKRRRGVIVCGPNLRIQHDDLYALAAGLGAPVLAEPLSGLRYAGSGNVIAHYEPLLRVEPMRDKLSPDFIIRFGDPPTSRAVEAYLLRHRETLQIVVAPSSEWPDPTLTATHIAHADPSAFCRSVLAGLNGASAVGQDWLSAWQTADSLASAAIEGELDEVSSTEISAVVDLAAVLPPASQVMLGNSMPVRDFDSFWPATNAGHFMHGNRGASGIDGVVSTAMGITARRASNTPAVLVIGDLSFYHDMNGLLAAQRFGLSATIVLINNDGGGIFSFLPQHNDAEHFETLFGTPHGLDFSHVAGLYGVDFQRVTTREEYRAALKASFDAPGVQIIEIKTDREENLRLHQRIWDAVANAVEPLVAASPLPQGEG
jgi:2-succinyl-5-enolpyruvyl-6-hydroxy-3-cyclohexene-1-carboxylate synthase